VLDKLLIDAAAEAGAEVREGFAAEELVFEDGRVTGIRGHGHGGGVVTENARVVIGADGLHSLVARQVSPESYHEKPAILCGYYTYWSGLPLNGFEAYDRGDRNWAAWPTNDGLTLLIVGWPISEFEAVRSNVERHYLETIARAPAFAERVRSAKREERFLGTSVPNYFRKPYGPGWALVGDAGYNRDFVTAQGISDAFRDAELCANAIGAAFSATRSFETRWSRIGPRATRCCRCTSSRTSSPASSRRHPKRSSSSAR
jgi:flavin-dependent dehydrogenase